MAIYNLENIIDTIVEAANLITEDPDIIIS